MTQMLSTEHMILKRPFMEFPPFGMGGRGAKIRDISGTIVKANVDGLTARERFASRLHGEGR